MRIGLDIDGVLANFLQGFIDRAQAQGVGHLFPANWRLWTTHHAGDDQEFKRIWDEVTRDDFFWAGLSPLVSPHAIGFPVAAYITARPCDTAVTQYWLQRHDFPNSGAVVTVPYGTSKVAAAKLQKLDLFVDDNTTNFAQLNAGGVPCLLWDTPVNQEFDAGDQRVRSFAEVLAWIKKNP